MSKGKILDSIILNTKMYDYFPDLDDRLLVLATTGIGERLPPEVAAGEYVKYKIYYSAYLNQKTLEFYGDQILSTIVVNESLKVYGLGVTSQSLDSLRKKMTNNNFLNEVAEEIGYCTYAANTVPNYSRYREDKVCANVFEAVLGALYVQYGLKNIDRIAAWLFGINLFRRKFNENIRSAGEIDVIYVLNRNFPHMQRDQTNLSMDETLTNYFKAFPYIQLQDDLFGGFDLVNTRNNVSVPICDEGDDCTWRTYTTLRKAKVI